MLGFVDANGKHLGPCLFQKKKEPVPKIPKLISESEEKEIE
jgi:hypothetical protein